MKLMEIFNLLITEVKSIKTPNYTFYNVKDFSTSEGSFSIYDLKRDSMDIVGRPSMFTILNSPNGYIVRNAFVPEDLQRRGIATEFYIAIDKESVKKTKHRLRSTQPRTLSNGQVVHELSADGIRLWDSLVSKGLAIKRGEKDYIFK